MVKTEVYKIIENKEISNLRKLQLASLLLLIEVDKICKVHNLKYWLDGGTLLGAIRHYGFIPWDDDIDICMPRDDYEKFIEVIKTSLDDDLVYEYKYTNTWYQENCELKMSFLKIYYLDNFRSSFKNNEWKGVFIDIFPVDCVDEIMCKKSSTKVISKLSKWIVKKPQSTGDLLRIIFSKFNLEKYLIKKCKKIENSGNGNYLSYGMETMFMDQNTIQKKEDIYPLREVVFESHKFYAPNNIDSYLTKLYGDYMLIQEEEHRVTHLEDIKIYV